MTLIVVPLGIRLGNSNTQVAILIGIYFIIPIAELLNFAIEVSIDRIGTEHHDLSGRAKDMGSAAISLSICIVLIIWIIIASERFIK